ncbi:Na+/H+ antiporter NhaD [Pseudobutyrivibrio sp. OR37]|uniref:SLC13 family permease n=1 Tax=Pseudobutyrivibrio sp. OR37 TaxID=1798186 RepID=UPI0008E36441|nr:SLC13 family permease [Pseudobutyrivibrio sp. OR37]SFI42360.1 Na+/H+ antiporter NhaD [Pseudobutyrivibrio sp. OR37]
MKSIQNFIKNEIVLCVAFILAVISCFIVPPTKSYLSYIDFRTLSILFTLMVTMAGFQKLSVFRQVGEIMVNRMNSLRGIALVLVFLCFISSMFITNDVALLTFVPFSIITLSIANHKEKFIAVIVLETLAANLGSMLTPLGNPQNLYLYSLSGMKLTDFINLMLPYSMCSLILLIACVLIVTRHSKEISQKASNSVYNRSKKDKCLILMYIVMFLVSLLVVARVIPYYVALVIVLAFVFIFDKRVLRKPDYSLLFTFIFLFIFIGNIKQMPLLSGLINSLLQINEVGISILLSQFISNVPAAILCSGFVSDIRQIIIGTNLGGLGTLIASMASLISFKQYSYIDGADNVKYIKVFSIMNIAFLVCLYALHILYF